MAHAVVMHVKLRQDRTPEEADKMLKEIVVPISKSLAGFQSGTWLHDGKNNGMGVIVFATAEDAEAARDALKPPPGGPELVSSAVHLVAAQA